MERFSRRRFLQYGLGAGAVLAAPSITGMQLPSAASLARASKIPTLTKYVEPVPVPGAGIVVASPSAPNTYSFTQTEIRRQLHPQLTPTPLWAYDDGSGLDGQFGSFGMAVVVHSGTAIEASFTNGLPEVYPPWIPVDRRLTPIGDEVRVMTHLHGGFVAADSDGNPAVTPDGFGLGDTQHVYYGNSTSHMPASLLWFHDHGLGATRLNVFAGLAAAYILRDDFDTGEEPNPSGIPGGSYEVPLVVQDRRFNTDGTFLYPTSDFAGEPWIGEYFGDVMLVNGKVWPYLNVEPRMYRFRILNGCNARILSLDIGGAPTWQIGAEGGLFDAPVLMRELVLAPAERADVIVDFSKLAGATLVMQNRALRRPISTPAPPLPQVMQIRVGANVTHGGPTTIPSSLPGRVPALGEPARTRYITLNEVAAETDHWFLNLNAMHFREPGEPITATETPTVGTVEDWVYINLTEDTHPIHNHLDTFQVVGRTPFDAHSYSEAFGAPFGVPGGIDPSPFITGPMIAAAPEERGFKDTVKANPGYLTTIRSKFDLPPGVTPPQTYVYHCHILEHEDNDMMRAFTVTA